jgi:hypothetical protein
LGVAFLGDLFKITLQRLFELKKLVLGWWRGSVDDVGYTAEGRITIF